MAGALERLQELGLITPAELANITAGMRRFLDDLDEREIQALASIRTKQTQHEHNEDFGGFGLIIH